MSETWLIGILSSIIGGLLVLFIQFTTKYVREIHGAYSGPWENQIYEKDEMIKLDSVYMRQDHERLYGTITRLQPADQNYRRYEFEGRIRGKDFFAVFWSKDPSVVSYGCWFLQQENDRSFKGYYFKTHELKKSISTVKLVMARPASYIIPPTRTDRVIRKLKELSLLNRIKRRVSKNQGDAS